MEDPVGITFELLKLKEQLHNNSLKCISRKKAYKFVQEWLKTRDPDDEPVAPATNEPAEPEPTYEQMRFDLDIGLSEDDDLLF